MGATGVVPPRFDSVGPCTLVSGSHRRVDATDADLGRTHANSLWVAADARIDNRDELRSALRRQVNGPLISDSELILAAYDRWGEGCPQKLMGDFGFAVWDAKRRVLFAARDHMGLRPLFYSRTASGVVLGSTLPAVLACLGREPSLDEEYLAGYLARLPSRERSQWAGVARLPPGFALLVTAERSTEQRWWNPELTPLHQGVDATIAEIRGTFDEAVRCRLPDGGGVSCHLSGGFDSSTVTATVVGMGVDPHAVSLEFVSNPEADERRHRTAVARALGIEVDVLPADDLDVTDPWRFFASRREPLFAVDAGDTAACFDSAAGQGCTVSLSGIGGDEALYGARSLALDLVASRQLGSALRLATHDGDPPLRAMRHMTGTLVREAAVGVVDALASRNPAGFAAVASSRLRARQFGRAAPWLATYPSGIRDGVRRDRAIPRANWERARTYLSSPLSPPALELNHSLAVERGVDVRYPFLDRRFIELCLRLPESQVRWAGEFRGLHRLAFRDRLPATVVARTDKADLSRPFMRKLLAAADRTQAQAAIHALEGRVEAADLMATYDAGLAAFDQPAGRPRGFHLWAALSAGAALQAPPGPDPSTR